MKNIWEALVGTPWWVYALFAYLIWMGVKATKTRIVKLKKLFIIPAVFIYMSVHQLLSTFTIDTVTIVTLTTSLFIGILVGFLHVHRQKISVDKKNMLLQVPGTWSTLIIIILIFISKYYFGYNLAAKPDMAQHLMFKICDFMISGLVTGFFVGRLVCYLHKFKTSQSTPLA